MGIVKLLVLGLLVVFVVGCNKYQWKDVSARNSFELDKYECAEYVSMKLNIEEQQKSINRPYHCTQYGDGYSSTVSCQQVSGGGNNKLAFLSGMAKGYKENRDIDKCLEARGWLKVKVRNNSEEFQGIGYSSNSSTGRPLNDSHTPVGQDEYAKNQNLEFSSKCPGEWGEHKRREEETGRPQMWRGCP